jgi:hypothetical protein
MATAISPCDPGHQFTVAIDCDSIAKLFLRRISIHWRIERVKKSLYQSS